MRVIKQNNALVAGDERVMVRGATPVRLKNFAPLTKNPAGDTTGGKKPASLGIVGQDVCTPGELPALLTGATPARANPLVCFALRL